MRYFIFLVLLFLVFLLIANSSVAQVDLTPNTPGEAPASGPMDSAPTSQPQVIYIQDNPATPNQSSPLLPVTGGCSVPYTVRSGDTLSQIAVTCRTTLACLMDVNPQITDIDFIHPGQQININNSNTEQSPASCSDSGAPAR